MSYTELDYLQEEVLGYFTEDKTDIDRSYQERIDREKTSGSHSWGNEAKKSYSNAWDKNKKNKYGQTDPSTRSAIVASGARNDKGHRFPQDTETKGWADKANKDHTEYLKGYKRANNERGEKKAQHPEHGPGNKNDRKRAKKAAQNQESTNESALAYDILNLFESEATDDICPKCGKRKCICDGTSKNECGSKC